MPGWLPLTNLTRILFDVSRFQVRLGLKARFLRFATFLPCLFTRDCHGKRSVVSPFVVFRPQDDFAFQVFCPLDFFAGISTVSSDQSHQGTVAHVLTVVNRFVIFDRGKHFCMFDIVHAWFFIEETPWLFTIRSDLVSQNLSRTFGAHDVIFYIGKATGLLAAV